jgi:catechol 2,3-dioxygenase-like lactoylglutathione lyase family enzyme
MFADTRAFSGFAVDDVEKAREFYGGTLGLRTSVSNGILTLHLVGDRDTIVYPKPGHHPADYTILNFQVDDIDHAVGPLAGPRPDAGRPRASRLAAAARTPVAAARCRAAARRLAS